MRMQLLPLLCVTLVLTCLTCVCEGQLRFPAVPALIPRQDDRPTCICPAIWRPVCGSNGVTYPNTCTANCRGQKSISCTGRCPCGLQNEINNDCLCVEIYTPVCGSNGQTYGNMCKAQCAGQRIDCDGKCPCAA